MESDEDDLPPLISHLVSFRRADLWLLMVFFGFVLLAFFFWCFFLYFYNVLNGMIFSTKCLFDSFLGKSK